MVAESIPAITLWQPWASLIAAGAKPYEFRGWPAPARLVGLRVAIHAGARAVRKEEVRSLLVQLQSPRAKETGVDPALGIPVLEAAMRGPGLPLSSVLCTATLGRPIRNAELAAAMGIPWVNDSDRGEHSNWGWPLTDVRVLEPFQPARGAQGWWNWTQPVAADSGPAVIFRQIDPRFPDQFYAHLGSTTDAPVIGDVATPDPDDPGDTWSARERDGDGHWPGFSTRAEAGRWLAERWLARREGRPLPPAPDMPVREAGHG